MTKKVATYQISDTFKITGRGIVFARFILDGVVSMGDYIEFSTGDKILKRKIKGVEGITFSQPNKVNTGLLIKCKNDSEIEELRKWEPKDTVATVIQLKEPIKLWADFNASSDFGLRLNCLGTIRDLERQNFILSPLLVFFTNKQNKSENSPFFILRQEIPHLNAEREKAIITLAMACW